MEGRSSIGRAPVSKTGGWGFKSLRPCEPAAAMRPRLLCGRARSQAGHRGQMNRATKRLLAKQEKQAERDRARSMPLPGAAGGGAGAGRGSSKGGGFGFGKRKEPGAVKEKRLKRWGRFLREVRVELKKVAWPSRNEVVTYTVVVLVSVTFVTMLVFGLDFGFGKAVLTFFK